MNQLSTTAFGINQRQCLAAAIGCCLTVSWLAVATGVACADDWPRWMGPRYDGVWYETGMIDKFPADGPDVVWRQPLGAGYAGPAIVGERIFIMDRTNDEGQGIETENGIRAVGALAGGERIRCLDMKTGAEIWSHQYDCPYKIAYPTGPRCTPTVDEGLVYALGAMGHLKCLAVDSGKIVWEKYLPELYSARPPFWGYASHPYVDGDNLIVPVGGKGSGLVAFNKATGQEVWKSITTNDIAYAPVVIHEPNEVDGKRQLVFWHGKGITSVDPADGREFWHVKFPEEANASIVTIATPLFSGNQLLIAEFYKGALLLEVESKPPAVKEIWRNFKMNPRLNDAMNCMMGTPVIKDGFVYGIAYSKSGAGIMRCLELATGKMQWTKELWMGGEKPLMFSNGFITANEDKYFIFNDLGELMIGKLTPTGFTEMDRANLVEPTSVARGRDVVWSHPAYSNGHVVVRNDKEIVCVNLKKKK